MRPSAGREGRPPPRRGAPAPVHHGVPVAPRTTYPGSRCWPDPGAPFGLLAVDVHDAAPALAAGPPWPGQRDQTRPQGDAPHDHAEQCPPLAGAPGPRPVAARRAPPRAGAAPPGPAHRVPGPPPEPLSGPAIKRALRTQPGWCVLRLVYADDTLSVAVARRAASPEGGLIWARWRPLRVAPRLAALSADAAGPLCARRRGVGAGGTAPGAGQAR